MAQQATLLILFLVFGAAMLIQYMLVAVQPSTIELFKNKNKNKKSKAKSKSKSKAKSKSKSKVKSKAKNKAKRKSKSKSKRKSKSKSKSKAMNSNDYVNCPKGYTCSPSGSSPMRFSEVVGSLLSPSLPDSRDMKDKLQASVDNTFSGQTPRDCPSDVTNCAISSRQMGNPAINCPDISNNCLAQEERPYNSNDYIKKDSIPCYGCNLK